MVHHLAGKTSVVLRYGRVFMKQAKTMEPDEAQQRHLDNPSAQTLLPIAPMFGHALSSPPIEVDLSDQTRTRG